MKISICTTNYNCAHALTRHLESVYRELAEMEFEYIVVDNKSRDTSLQILGGWAASHANMTVLTERCTMGEGREIAFRHSTGDHIMVLDTDVVYSQALRTLANAYLEKCPELSVQAVFCGLFPRNQWTAAGGRRSLNTNEDLDMWVRVARLGTMRWYPIYTGENLKEANAWGRGDYLSGRYSRSERVVRLARRELDRLKTRKLERVNVQSLIDANRVDLGMGSPGPWPQARTRTTPVQNAVQFVREFKQTLKAK